MRDVTKICFKIRGMERTISALKKAAQEGRAVDVGIYIERLEQLRQDMAEMAETIRAAQMDKGDPRWEGTGC